jgi:hypothetical protein
MVVSGVLETEEVGSSQREVENNLFIANHPGFTFRR